MEFCKVALTFESVDETLWCDHSNETSLPVLTHGATCFSKYYEMKFGIFCWILPLATFGSDRVKTEQCDMSIPTSTAISAPSSSSWSLLAFRSSLSCYKNERFNMNKRIFVWKKFSHCGITQLLKSNVIVVIVVTSGEILDKPRLTWIWYWSRCFFWRTAKLKR